MQLKFYHLNFLTGEKIGVEYLYAQTGKFWSTTPFDPDTPDDIWDHNETLDSLDEGFDEYEYESDLTIPMPSVGFAVKSHFKLITLFSYLLDIFSSFQELQVIQP